MIDNSDNLFEFRKKFYNNYHQNVLPLVKKHEDDRKFFLKVFLVITVVWAIILIGIYHVFFVTLAYTKFRNVWELLPFGLYFLIAPLGLYLFFKSRVEGKIKDDIMNVFLKVFGDFHWTQLGLISDWDLQKSKLFGSFSTRTDDDNFFGTYKNVKIVITETELTQGRGKYKSTSFDGIIIKIKMNKKIEGHTIIRSSSIMQFGISGMEDVILEDTEFNKRYSVYSSSQIESRYLLTTAFIDRFKNIEKVFKSPYIQCSFLDEDMLLSINVGRDLFSLGSLFKRVDDTAQFQELFDQLISILSIVDVLQLDKKIGL